MKPYIIPQIDRIDIKKTDIVRCSALMKEKDGVGGEMDFNDLIFS